MRAKDTPNFIANRVGIFGMLATIKEAEKFGLSVDVVDDLTGAKLGRAKSGTFRTADVVGLDTMAHVIKTMQDTLPRTIRSPRVYETPPVLASADRARARSGQKTGAGFYKKVGKDIQRLDPANGEYVAGGGKADDMVARILKKKDPVEKTSSCCANRPTRRRSSCGRSSATPSTTSPCTSTAIADNARDVDFAMRWGFGWSVGPFEIWQAAGWTQVAEWVKEDIDAGKALCEGAAAEPGCSRARSPRSGVHTAGRLVVAGAERPSCRAPNLPVYAAPAFPRAAASARRADRQPPAPPCSRTTRCACGHSRARRQC